MIRKNYDKRGSVELFVKLDNILRSVIRRGVFYSLTTHSDEAAVVEITMTGSRGAASVRLVIVRENIGDGLISLYKWTAYSNSAKYELNSLDEVRNLSRVYVSRLRTIVNKIY
jgi:hypothetical protein